jgi:branched-chain amino acid transport system substrate-binding protein
LAAVSGAEGGEACSTFQECADLLADGEEIDYETVSGAGAFNENNDPASAFIGIYQFGPDNKSVWVKAEEGEAEA